MRSATLLLIAFLSWHAASSQTPDSAAFSTEPPVQDQASDSAAFSTEELRAMVMLMQMGIDATEANKLSRAAMLRLIDAHLTAITQKDMAEEETKHMRSVVASSNEACRIETDGLRAEVRTWRIRFGVTVGVGVLVSAAGVYGILSRP